MSAPLLEKEKPHRTTTTLVWELKPPGTLHELPRASHESSEYKKHSLASAYWGDISESKQPMRRVGAEEARATVLRGLLDAPLERRQRNPLDWVISLAVHILIVSAVIIIPLTFTQGIDLRNLELTYLTVPRPPAAAPPPAPTAAVQQVRRVVRPVQSTLTAPTLIPKQIAIIKEPPAPEISEGVVGGVPGGETGGAIGGIVGGTDQGFTPPPPPPKEPQQKIYRVGGVVKPPQLITLVQPVYPPVARAAHAQGTVEVEAIIDEHGNVVEARAVSGPGLLMAAAVRAVSQWKYEPTDLDGIPVAIRMEVHVYFHLQ